MLTAELAAGAKLRVVSSERMALARQSLHPSEKKALKPVSMERLHALVGADFAVNGTYLPLGDRDDRRIRLDIRILTMPEGDTVTSVVEAGTEAELFDLVTRAGSRLRNALGFSMPTAAERLQARGLVPAGAEAIRLSAEALSRLRSFDPVGARSLLQRAEALEPDSVAIQSALAGTWTMLGQDVRAREAALKAFEARGSLPQEAQLAVEARFYETVKDWARASETYRSLGTLFPDEIDYDLRLAEMLSMGGQDHEALAVINKMHERPSPDGEDPRIDVTETIVAMRHADYARMKKASEAAVAKGRRLGLWLITAKGLIYQAHLAILKGRPGEASEVLHQAKELALRAGDRWTVGQVDANLGIVLQQQGDLDGAEQVHQRALVTARELGSALAISSQLLSLGQIQRDRGHLNEACTMLEEALDWSRRIDYRRWQGYTQVKLGTVHLYQGDPEGARHWLADALTLSQLIGNARNEVEALQALAELEALEGKIEEALRLQRNALQALLELRIPSLAAGTLASSADLLARTGDLPLARRRLLQAEAAGQHAADRLLSGHLLGVRAQFAFRAGKLSAARTVSESQLQLARESGARLLEAAALRGLARTARAAGDLRGARDLLEGAFRISTASGDELTRAALSLDLARLSADEEDFPTALRLAGEAATWYRTHQFPGGEATALAILAEAQLELGRPGEARDSSARARAVAPRADQELRLAITPALARVEAATDGRDVALRTLEQAATEAQRLGFVPAAIEARLAQGEILMARGEADAARTVLQPMHQQARQKGFLLAAKRAARLLSRATPAAMH
jgi:tetratricopeptide (TPR) repeat protein